MKARHLFLVCYNFIYISNEYWPQSIYALHLGTYMQAALAHLRDEGEVINEEDEVRLSPLRHAHINMLGHYTFTLAEQVIKGQLRPLKQAEESEEWPL